MGLDGNSDNIPLAIHRLDDLRRPGIVAQNLAQPADSHVDASVTSDHGAASAGKDLS